jgi:hypothetical protein
MQDTVKRQWTTINTQTDTEEAKEQKRDGITDVLTRSTHDRDFRNQLLSKDPETVKAAIKEGGNFESLPGDLKFRCFERDEADYHVHLVLPKFEPIPGDADVEEGWRCTWFPYRNGEGRSTKRYVRK